MTGSRGGPDMQEEAGWGNRIRGQLRVWVPWLLKLTGPCSGAGDGHYKAQSPLPEKGDVGGKFSRYTQQPLS